MTGIVYPSVVMTPLVPLPPGLVTVITRLPEDAVDEALTLKE